MSETMVHRMATAMEAEAIKADTLPTTYGDTHALSRKMALAALKAMRWPTAAMQIPGLDAIDEFAENYDLRVVADCRSIECWRAMIDAAIHEAENAK